MLKSSLLISFIFIFALGPQVILGDLDAETWDPIKDKLSEKDSDFRKYISEFENILTNAKTFEKYPVTKYLGSGTGGVVFDVESEGNNLAAKVLIEKNNSFENCKDNKILAELKDRKASYVNELIDIEPYKGKMAIKSFGKERKVNIYACILILEKADTDLRIGEIFETNSKENWPALFRFFGKLIQSFAEINFKGKVLHGDIKPENIMVKVSKKGYPLELNVEPVVIDFDLILENKNEEDFSDEQLRYAEDYRPKEMTEDTEDEHLDKTDAWYENWQNYKYSGEFLEDSYALGVTILEVLRLQSENVDETSVEYTKLKRLARIMKGPRYFYHKKLISRSNPDGLIKFRPNTKEALEEFLRIFNLCETCLRSKLTIEFFKNAKASLDEMNNMLTRI